MKGVFFCSYGNAAPTLESLLSLTRPHRWSYYDLFFPPVSSDDQEDGRAAGCTADWNQAAADQ